MPHCLKFLVFGIRALATIEIAADTCKSVDLIYIYRDMHGGRLRLSGCFDVVGKDEL